MATTKSVTPRHRPASTEQNGQVDKILISQLRQLVDYSLRDLARTNPSVPVAMPDVNSPLA